MQPEISKYEALGLRYILITADTRETIEMVLAQNDLDIMVLSDPGNAIATANGIQGWPTSLLFDRQGHLLERTVGWDGNRSLPAWKAKVENALKEQ